MRIGTWNLDARWSPAHTAAMTGADCDVWLLTEVAPGTGLPGYQRIVTRSRMTRGQHYAGVLSRMEAQLVPEEPHPASVAARATAPWPPWPF